MKRTRILTTLTALLLAVTLHTATVGSTLPAQLINWGPNTCYNVDLTNLPATCFPLCIYTSWGGGGVVWPSPAASCYNTPGLYTECPTTPPPIGTPLDFVTVCGIPTGNTIAQYTISCPAPGCSLCVVLCLDTTMYLTIKVYPGPCPSTPLSCP